ncbi:XapX domain-containing protein [Fictibacillus sp. WQ 8-8]|uniref:XapX domain-containing protein n=1 Tax=Fictibacillus marinisediminis TaxID=2878389 RepID=A0A9X1XKJ4_9BACL|nr:MULTISPECIES: XapX domain-containing protein [Fictibacillus]SFE83959.1 XapX domain-containing protein [Bacillus sp. OV194]MCK6259259.1 XapX domain-containing protein [Fictibacillus marinisediminis]MCQ6264948.1 XapX domain-containing protein [Fictibacillus sp. WQ 8-8]MED2972061.1 XapX domain-containing protein [Fictibacillus sp. B-59209]UZJ79133.1 XapX domain-containing protein [Fictibacillus sp. KU28468]
MKLVILALITGAAVGIVFAMLKLPIPAPPALSGIAGIVGIYLGYKIYLWAFSLFMKP